MPKKGYKQTAEHVKKRADNVRGTKHGPAHPNQLKGLMAGYAKPGEVRFKRQGAPAGSGKFWAHSVFYRYGISEEKYRDMLAEQNGVCAVCKRPPTETKLCIDHNHKTGKVRGLLHRWCNVIVGYLEAHNRLKDFQDYLEAHRQKRVPYVLKNHRPKRVPYIRK